MKSTAHTLMLALACALALTRPTAAQGPAFNSGSNGSDGPLNVTENTILALPPDGVFHFTTIQIASNTTLKIGRNGLNTPVHLLATGDVLIAGTIDVSGTSGTEFSGGFGGPGGWGGGSPGVPNNPPGDGLGPGGGRAGTIANTSFNSAVSTSRNMSGGGSYGSSPSPQQGSAYAGTTYGSALLVPLMGGSGGAGAVAASNWNSGGGGGGGAILVASNTKITVSGTINARGGGTASPPYSVQYGSGGAIRLVAPEIAGTGSLWANGGGASWGSSAGFGRIRLDCSVYSGTLSMPHAASTIGYNPVIFPANPPSLRLKNVAGTEIPANNQDAVIVTLPADGSPLQAVTVEASNFKGEVRFVVSVVPERGPSTFTEGVIPNPAGATATRTVNVPFPLNASSQVFVWTKQMTAQPPPPAP